MKESSRIKSGCDFLGNIADVRSVEDCIRATHRYTEGIGTIRAQHPVQGDEFASKVFCKHYEVYPEMEVSWDMPAGQAFDLLWGDTPCINVVFKYDYRSNKASVEMRDGPSTVKQLEDAIPGLRSSLRKIANGNSKLVE